MKNSLFLLLAIILFPSILSAEEERPSDKPSFQVSPSGRVLIDGALYASPEKEMFKDGMAIPEARLGVKMKYDKWSSWIDVGFAYGKIGLRNMWIQYDFNQSNSVRFGNFIQPFGLQSTTSLSLKSTFEQPMASAPFTPGIQLGAMYAHVAPAFLSLSSFHVESSALIDIMNYPMFNQQGYSILTRFVGRTPNSGKDGKPILQAGISGGFSTPQRLIEEDTDVHNGFMLSSNFPTKVTTMEAVGTTVDKSKNSFKLTPELLLGYQRVAIESQYFFQQINRRDNLKSYKAQGAYVTLRGMITGGQYTYDNSLGQIDYPKKNALEGVLNYSWTGLSDLNAGIMGGNANCLSATLNYYFNPYITARLNYFYAHTWNRSDQPKYTLNGFQLRLMVLF